MLWHSRGLIKNAVIGWNRLLQSSEELATIECIKLFKNKHNRNWKKTTTTTTEQRQPRQQQQQQQQQRQRQRRQQQQQQQQQKPVTYISETYVINHKEHN